MAITWNSTDKWIEIDSAKTSGTATAGGTSTLTDSGASWTTNAYVGHIVRITSGTGEGQTRIVKSNTSTVLTIFETFDTTPSTDSAYSIAWTPKDVVSEVGNTAVVDYIADAANGTNCIYVKQGGIRVESGGHFGYGMNPVLTFEDAANDVYSTELNNRNLRGDSGSYIDFGVPNSSGIGVGGGVINLPIDRSMSPGELGTGVFLPRMWIKGTFSFNGTRFTTSYDWLPQLTDSDADRRWWQLFFDSEQTGYLRDCQFENVQPATTGGAGFVYWIRPVFQGLFVTIPSNYILDSNVSYDSPIAYSSIIAQPNPDLQDFKGNKLSNFNFFGSLDSAGRNPKPFVPYKWWRNGTSGIGYRPMIRLFNAYSENSSYQKQNFIAYDTYIPPDNSFGYVWIGRTIDWSVKDIDETALEDATVAVFDKNGNNAINTGVTGTDPAVPTYTGADQTDANGELTTDVLWGRLEHDSSGGLTDKDVVWSSGYPVYPYTIKARKYGYMSFESTRDGVNNWGNGKGNAEEVVKLSADTFVVANEATASGYSSKFSLDWTNKIITVTGTATPQQMYDYTQYASAQSANMQYDELMTAVSPGEFNLGSTRIVIASGGTLTVDTDETIGSLVFGDTGSTANAIKVQTGGELVIGTESTIGRCIDFTRSLITSETTYTYSSTTAPILVESGGELDWSGGEVQSHGAITFASGSVVTIHRVSCKLTNEGEQTTAAGSYPKLRCYSSGVNVYGLTTYGYVFGLDSEPGSWENWITSNTDAGVYLGGINSFAVLNGVTFDMATMDTGTLFWNSLWIRLINIADGTNFTTKGNSPTYSLYNKGLQEVRQEITFSATNGSGAKFYTKDTNNGNRLGASQIGTNSTYLTDRTYTLTESGGSASYTTDGGVLTGVHYRDDASGINTDNNEFDSRGINNDKTDIFNWLKVRYGYQPATLDVVMKGTSAVQSSIAQLLDLGITETTKATVAAYTGITPVYSGGTLTVTVTENHTWNEVYDYIKYYESINPANVWANGKESFVTTSNKLSYTYNNLVIVVSGATLTAGAGQVLPTNPTVNSGAFLSDAINLFYDGADLVKASRAYFQVKDSITADNIEGAVIGFGDATTQARLLYNTSFAKDTLVTDASGKADGYFAYEVGATAYTDMKQITGEYDHIFSTIPRTLTGASIGSSASPEVVRLAPDSQVVRDKASAGMISGISVDVPTDTIDLGDQTLSVCYDSLKYQVTADADIDTGVPGCMYYCLYGLPLMKSGAIYTGRSSSTIYQNYNGTGATFGTGIIEFDTPCSCSKSFNEVQFNFEADGTYDFRGGSFSGTVTVDTIGDYTVLAKFPTGTSVTNNDATNITVETSTGITIANANIADGSRVQLYNVTQDEELENTTVSGGSGYSYSATVGAGEEIEVGDVVRLRATYEDGATYKENYEESASATTSNITFLGTQIDWTSADSLSVDGSAQTEFTADYPNIQVDVDATGNTFNVANLIGWLCYIQTTEDGIRNFYGCVADTDVANWKINTTVVDLMLDNINTATATQSDSVILMRDDNVYPQVVPTSGGGGIGMIQSGLVFVTETGVSGLTAQESAQLFAIPTECAGGDGLTLAEYIALK